MKKVLIVDDDESFLHSLIEGFKAYEDTFTITTAGDGLEAVAALKEHDISLLITDLNMPRMDGFELVAHLSNNFPEIPVIVMTAFGTPEMEENLHNIGNFQYIEKPIDFSVLVKKVLTGLDGASRGYITGVSLSSFLQLLELDKKSCTLSIHAGTKKGTLYFRDGNLLDATTRDLQGSEAAFAIVGWKNVEIGIENNCSLTQEKIKESLGFILLEGCRRKDERATDADTLSDAKGGGGFGNLDSLNMDDLDLDLSATSPAYPAGRSQSSSSQVSGPAQSNPLLAQFITMLRSFPEIISSTISTKDGTVLHQSGDADSNTANFITYVAVAAEQIENAIGASGRQYSIFTLADDSKLLVLCGNNLIVGLSVAATVIPEAIANGLRPVLSRITL